MARTQMERTAGPPLASGCSGRFLPDAALRRRLVAALICGASRRRCDPPRPLAPPPPAPRPSGSGRPLSELFEAEPSPEDLSTVAGLAAEPRRRLAAVDVRRRAKDDPAARARLAAAGAVGALVELVGSSGDDDLEVEVLYALLNLGIGNDSNKQAICQAGALERILTLINANPSPRASEAIVANLLSLSAVDGNKPLIGSSIAVPFLITIFQNHQQQQTRHDSLRTLFNLSLSPSNAPHLIANNLVSILLSSLDDMDLSDRCLAILSNLASSPHGQSSLRSSHDVYSILVDVLNWTDSPECQEKAAYLLMVMAHKASAVDRAAMLEVGIASSLLEVMLVGTALAQKRAARVLDCLREEKGKQVSEGFDGRGNGFLMEVSGDQVEDGVMGEERRAVKELVRQSLQSNLRRIVSRANSQYNFAPSDRFLVMAGTSRSLPL